MNLQVFQVSLNKVVGIVAIAIGTLASLPALAQSTPGSVTVPSEPVEATPGATTPGATVTPDPSATPTAPASETAAPTTTSAKTIVDVATSSGSFKTLVAAVEAAGLTDILSGEGPYTVFAPTDEAFAALPAGTVESLLQPKNRDKLRKVLTYHVLPIKVESAAIKGGRIATVQGSRVALAVQGGGVMVNDAKVTQADVQASNGVIHAIDKVILPPDL